MSGSNSLAMKLDPRQIGRYTEADVVVELCHRLKLLKLDVRSEVYLPSTSHRSGFMRCDVAIVEGDEIRCVLEVKDKMPSSTNPNGRQTRAYEAVSEIVPVFYVYGMDRIDAAVRMASGWCKSGRRLTAR